MTKLYFQIPYHTAWGERLLITFTTSHCMLGEVRLSSNDGSIWTGELTLPMGTEWLTYIYNVCRDGKVVRSEENAFRRLVPGSRSQLALFDTWTETGIPSVFRHAAFLNNVFGPHHGTPFHSVRRQRYCLTLTALPAPDGKRWGVVGSSATLGAWDVRRAVPLQRTAAYTWVCPLTAADFDGTVAYKFLLIDEADPQQVVWEEGDDRRLPQATSMQLRGGACHAQASSPRFNLPPWRGSGVVIPVFSLRSRHSFGVGDFGDLRRMVDWAASVGMSAIQVLPVNDTTRHGRWEDSYPYSSVSVFALHPLYLDCSEWEGMKLHEPFRERGALLNAKETLDYEGAFRLKMDFLENLYAKGGQKAIRGKGFKEFVAQNKWWLRPYAVYRLRRSDRRTANFFYFVQYLLHRQLAAVHDYARSRGVILKGDIPIGISRDSVPATVDARLFHFDGQAGAPPDDFAKQGQNWGFPTYNWEEMAKDGYQWWRERFRQMARYFDAYRIDHVLGFFRIWEIPTTQIYGTLGRFRPALPLSAEEIRAFGFTLPPAFYTRPHLSERRYGQLQAAAASRDVSRFFQREGGYYTLVPEASTQQGVARLTDEEPLRSLLFDVVADVLFIEDPTAPGKFHPRVCAQQTEAFAALLPAEQEAFNRLYDDFFYFRHNDFWAAEALKKLPPLLAPASHDPAEGSLLPCAEDLGMVPASVKGVLEQLKVLSLEIQTMPKDYGRRFADLQRNPYLSVATIATHDMPPFRLWWQQDAARAQAFWTEALGHDGAAPAEATPELCEEVVRRHMASPSMLCLIALQDYLGMDATLRHPRPEEEQINVPADPHHKWRYRMHLTIEDLYAATGFNERLRTLCERNKKASHF